MGPTAEAPCFLNRSSWHGDDPNPIVRIEMLSRNQFCGVSVRADGRSGGGTGVILVKPANGTARVRRVGQTAQAEYKPNSGFVGEDEFKTQISAGAPTLTVHVSVRQTGR